MSHDDPAERRRIFRIGLAIALGLVIGEAQEEAFSFLAPLLAFQLLMKTPQAPSVRQGIGFVLVVTIANCLALVLASSLQDRHFIYLMVLALVYFGCFFLQLRGQGGPLPGMLLTCNAMVPVLAVISRDLAQDFVSVFIMSSVSAVLLAWLAHAVFPDDHRAIAATAPAASRVSRAEAIRIALVSTVILMPAVVHYLANDNEVSIVVLMTIISVLSQPVGMHRRAALGLLLGNLLGGLAASLVYYAVAVLPWLPFLFLLALAVTLLLAEAATRPVASAGVFAIAIPTFLILLSLGLTPITDGSGAAFVSRVIDVALASLYALAGIVLLGPIMEPQRRPSVAG